MHNGTASTGTSRQAGAVGQESPSPHSWISTSVSVDSSPRSYLFTSGTVQIPVQAWQLWLTTLQIGSAQRRFVTETVLKSPIICVNRLSGLNPVRFSCRCKSYSVFKCEHSLSLWKDWRTLRGEGEFHHRRLAQYYGNTPVCQAGRRGFTPQKRIKKEDAEGAQPPLSTCGFLIKKRTVRFTVIQNL